MYGILHRRWEQSGNDEQERLMLSFDKMFTRERDTALGDLFSYWQAKRTNGDELPLENHFSPQELLPDSLRVYTAWVETETANPFNFVVRNHPSLSAWANQSDLRLSEIGSKMNAKSCAAEYLNCKNVRRPLYHEIEQTIEGNSRHFTRLLLPVIDNTNSVTKLIYAVRMFSATGLKKHKESQCTQPELALNRKALEQS